MGNHEAMLLEFLRDPASVQAGMFIYNGGGATLASYGEPDGSYHIPDDHLDFFENLRLNFQTPTHFFVHAGVPNIPLEKVSDKRHRQHMLWIRDPFLNGGYTWSKCVVHGHTPVSDIDYHDNRINIDTGCVMGNRLTAIDVTQNQVYQVMRGASSRREYLRDESSRRHAVRFAGSVPVTIDFKGSRVDLATIDYNELGMLCRDVGDEPASLCVGDVIRGEIGPPEMPVATFEGAVVRRSLHQDGFCYAIRIFAETPPA